MRISDWSSDVCSSDLLESATEAELVAACARANNVLKRFGSGWTLHFEAERREALAYPDSIFLDAASWLIDEERRAAFESAGAHFESRYHATLTFLPPPDQADTAGRALVERSEEHTSELQSLMRISYAVFCLKKKKKKQENSNN